MANPLYNKQTAYSRKAPKSPSGNEHSTPMAVEMPMKGPEFPGSLPGKAGKWKMTKGNASVCPEHPYAEGIDA